MKRCTLSLLAGLSFITSAWAQPAVVSSGATSYYVPLALGKSIVIDLPADAADVLIGNPRIAATVLRTKRRAYITGGEIGLTSVYFFDEQRKPITSLEINVIKDMREIQGPTLPNSVAEALIVEVYRGPAYSYVLCGVDTCMPEPPTNASPSTTFIFRR